jgi:putative FmdB family regulatory protein
MPLYEFECLECKYVFEVIKKMKDQSIEMCPLCKHPSKKLISSPGFFNLIGKGFFKNDYQKKQKTSKEKE